MGNNVADASEYAAPIFNDSAGPRRRSEVDTAQGKLIVAMVICVVFMVLEVIGGFLAGSVAIMTDAAHLLSDVTGFGISLLSIWLAKRGSTPTLSFGFKRAEILGALLSVLVIWFLTGVLVYEAVLRTVYIMQGSRTKFVNGRIMFAVSTVGLVVNIVLLQVLGHDHGHSHGGGGGGGHGHSHGSSASASASASAPKDHGSHGHAHEHAHGHTAGGEEHTEQHVDDHHGHSHGDSSSHAHHDGQHTNHVEPVSRAAAHAHATATGDYGTLSSPTLLAAGGAQAGAADAETAKLLTTNKHMHSTPHPKENINVLAAYAHAIGDLIQSVGVCIAGLLIWIFPGEQYPMVQLADPCATFLFSFLVIYSTLMVTRTSLGVLMEAVPAGIDLLQTMQAISSVPEVLDVHDLHIWSLTHGEPSLSVHLSIPPGADANKTLLRVQHVLRQKGIMHSTVQIEIVDTPDCEDKDCAADDENPNCEGFAIKCADHQCNDFM